MDRLRRAFNSAQWEIAVADHNAFSLDGTQLFVSVESGRSQEIERFERIWLLGFGARSTFLDRMQLLRSVNPEKLVNSIDAYIYLHNKAALNTTRLGEFAPPSVASNSEESLIKRIQQGGDWVIKPTAGSFGRDVFEVSASDPNLVQIVEHVSRQGFALLQQRVPTEHEKRWMMACGQTLGVYEKVKTGLRGNIAAHATAKRCKPSQAEQDVASKIAALMPELGIHVCAVDIAHPYLLDVNFVNPGWFQTMESLTGEDYAVRLPPLFESSF